jgi:DNA-binding beta-propeller fold protein YncE
MFKKISTILFATSLAVGVLVPTPATATTISSTGVQFNRFYSWIASLEISPDGNTIYAITGDDSLTFENENHVLKIDAATFELLDTLALPEGFNTFTSVISKNGKYLYVGGYASHSIAKIATTNMSLVSTIEFEANEGSFIGSFISPDGSAAYFLSDWSRIMKINIAGEFSLEGTLILGEEFTSIYAGAISSDGSTGYVVSSVWSPDLAPTIFSLDLEQGEIIDSAALPVGDGYVTDIVLQNDNSAIYMASSFNEVRATKINLNNLSVSAVETLPAKYTGFSLLTKGLKKNTVLARVDSVDVDDETIIHPEILEVSMTDLSIKSSEIKPENHRNSYAGLVNPVTGAFYYAYAHFWPISGPMTAPGIEIGGPASKPTRPQDVNAKYKSKKVTFIWSAPSFNGGSEITKYQYCFAKCSKEKSWKNTTSRKVVKTGLSKGKKGTLKIRAVNAIGKGAISTFAFTQSK